MNWAELREWGDRPMNLPFTAEMTVDTSENPSPLRALELMERGLIDYSALLAQQLRNARDHLAQKVPFSRHGNPLLPWLPNQTVSPSLPLIVRCGELASRFALVRPLPGQSLRQAYTAATIPISLYSDAEIRPIELTLEQIELVAGSLHGIVKGALTFATGAITFIATAFAVPPVLNGYHKQIQEHRIQTVLQGEECNDRGRFRLQIEDLDKIGPEQFDFAAPNLSAGERALRVCNTQIALKMAQGSPSAIDGVLGQDTKNALRDYSHMKNLPNDIHNQTLRGQLLRDLRTYKPDY